MGENRDRVIILAVVLLTVMSVISLILGVVSFSRSTGGANTDGTKPVNIFTSSSSAQSTEKTWMIAIGYYGDNTEYLDEDTYTIRGFIPDIVDAVCSIANRNCKLVYDIYSNCWDSNSGQRPRGGIGLMSVWYDACSGWIQTFDRLLTFSFTKPLFTSPDVGLYVNISSRLNYDDLDLTNLKVGFADGWATDEFCLRRYTYVTGVTDLRSNQIFHYASEPELIEALHNGELDIVFLLVIDEGNIALDKVRLLSPSDFPNMCLKGGSSLMSRHNNAGFVLWWNEAFELLVQRGRYDEICKSLEERHGLHVETFENSLLSGPLPTDSELIRDLSNKRRIGLESVASV